MNMYKLLIEENTRYDCDCQTKFWEDRLPLSSSEKKGDIDIYPEFTGTITESLLQPSPKVSHDAEEGFEVHVMECKNRTI